MTAYSRIREEIFNADSPSEEKEGNENLYLDYSYLIDTIECALAHTG